MPLPITTTLGDRMVADMLGRAQDQNVRARQADAERRLLMMSENWREIVYAVIDARVKTSAVRIALKARVQRTYNVLLQVLRRVCVAYKIPPLRTLDGASESAQKAWSKLGIESSIATHAKKWERHAFALNVILVVPRVREDPSGQGRRLSYDMITPDRCEAYMDERDPMGTPVKIAFWEKHCSDRERDPWRWCVLDEEAWTYYDEKGRKVETQPHGAGVFPGTVWRLDDPVDDWWSSFRGEGLIDATPFVAYIAARRDWVRDGQDRRKEIFAAQDMARVPQQVAGAEGPMHIPLAPGAFSYESIESITSIEGFEAHIKSTLYQAAEYLGVPAQLVSFDFDSGAETERTAMQHAALADVRADHIEFYRRSERDLAWKTALVLRGQRHPLASQLPPDMIAEKFAIEYPELSFTETPGARLDVSKKRVEQGLSSTIREYRREYPHLTFEQAREQVLAIAAEEGELNQFYIQNNIPRGAEARLKTLAQMQGAIGGKASGEARQPEDDNDDDDKPGRADAADDRTDDDE